MNTSTLNLILTVIHKGKSIVQISTLILIRDINTYNNSLLKAIDSSFKIFLVTIHFSYDQNLQVRDDWFFLYLKLTESFSVFYFLFLDTVNVNPFTV